MRTTSAACALAGIAALGLVGCSSSGTAGVPANPGPTGGSSSSSASVPAGPPTLPNTIPSSGGGVISIEASRLAAPDSAQNTAFDFHTYLYLHDLAGLQVLTCPGAQLTLTQDVIDGIGGIDAPETAVTGDTGDTATARIPLSVNGTASTATLALRHAGGGGTWCVQTATISAGEPSGSLGPSEPSGGVSFPSGSVSS